MGGQQRVLCGCDTDLGKLRHRSSQPGRGGAEPDSPHPAPSSLSLPLPSWAFGSNSLPIAGSVGVGVARRGQRPFPVPPRPLAPGRMGLLSPAGLGAVSPRHGLSPAVASQGRQVSGAGPGGLVPGRVGPVDMVHGQGMGVGACCGWSIVRGGGACCMGRDIWGRAWYVGAGPVIGVGLAHGGGSGAGFGRQGRGLHLAPPNSPLLTPAEPVVRQPRGQPQHAGAGAQRRAAHPLAARAQLPAGRPHVPPR